VSEGIILDEGVEVDAALEADGVGSGPAPGCGIEVASAEVN